MTTVTICLLVIIALFGLGLFAVSWLRKQPGLRRRQEDPSYDGPPRRNSDCSLEIRKARAPEKTEIEAADDVTITPSKPRPPKQRVVK